MDVDRMFSKLETPPNQRQHPTPTAARELLVVSYGTTECHGTEQALARRRNAPPTSSESWPYSLWP
jgi:hypothetical protein